MRARTHWRRLALHGAPYAGRRRQFELLYLLADPWEMGSDAEASRLDWTDRLIAAQFARVGTLLELGCGEGHQSVHLARHCDQLFGVDVSRIAVARCRRRCPRGLFKVGSAAAPGFPYAPPVFDLVVACETLYYMRHPGRAIERLCRLGRACLVTYRAAESDALDPCLAEVAEGSELHRCGAAAWRAVWWRNRPLDTGLVAERLQ